MNDEEIKEFTEFREYVKRLALKKMKKQEKKLLNYAKLYYGAPVAVLYIWKDGCHVYAGYPDFEILKARLEDEWK